MKRSALQNKQVVLLRMAFRARKVFGTFEKRAPGYISQLVDFTYYYLEFYETVGIVVGKELCPPLTLK